MTKVKNQVHGNFSSFARPDFYMCIEYAFGHLYIPFFVFIINN